MGNYYSSYMGSGVTTRKYNLKKDKFDHRDYKVTFNHPDDTLPTYVDLRQKELPVFDQLALGSCTSNSIAYTAMYDLWKQDERLVIPSRLFIYYNERKLDGTIKEDAGSSIKQSVQALQKFGFPSEDKWQYDITKFTEKPPQELYDEAAVNKARVYCRVTQELNQMKKALASGYPLNLGIDVYDSFESEEAMKTGNVPMPTKDSVYKGGHAICIIGYDDSKKCFKFVNSWSESYGDNGFGYIPYDYLTNPQLCSDIWLVTRVENWQDDRKDPFIIVKK